MASRSSTPRRRCALTWRSHRPDRFGDRSRAGASGSPHPALCDRSELHLDLDLLLVNFYKNVVLYRNNTNDKNWLKVKPVGVKSNLDGIGAQVRLFRTQGNKRTLVGFRHIQAGAGYGRSSPLEAHFGLGPKPASTYEVEVFFPATKTRVVKKSVKPTEYVVVREK